MTEKEKIEQLVAMLDSFVEQGGGHMNIIMEDTQSVDDTTKEDIKIETFRSNDCSNNHGINTACAVPTLHKGIDDN